MEHLYKKFKEIDEKMYCISTHVKEYHTLLDQYIKLLHNIRDTRIKLINIGYKAEELPFPIYEELSPYRKTCIYKKFFYRMNIIDATNLIIFDCNNI